MLWRQPIGLGWSAFSVSGPRAITQEQRHEDELTVCYELQTGHALWAHTNHVRFSEMLGGDGYARRNDSRVVGSMRWEHQATWIASEEATGRHTGRAMP